MITLLLVDDQPTVRKGLRMCLALEADVTVVGEAQDGTAALDLAAALDPDVVVMDLLMPGMDGLATTRALCRRCPRSAVIVLSLYDDMSRRGRAFESGAVAFVSKHEGAAALPLAIRQAAARQPRDPCA